MNHTVVSVAIVPEVLAPSTARLVTKPRKRFRWHVEINGQRVYTAPFVDGRFHAETYAEGFKAGLAYQGKESID